MNFTKFEMNNTVRYLNDVVKDEVLSDVSVAKLKSVEMFLACLRPYAFTLEPVHYVELNRFKRFVMEKVPSGSMAQVMTFAALQMVFDGTEAMAESEDEDWFIGCSDRVEQMRVAYPSRTIRLQFAIVMLHMAVHIDNAVMDKLAEELAQELGATTETSEP